MDVFQMRKEISLQYPGDKWHHRVASMSEQQVIAVWHSIEERKAKAKKQAKAEKQYERTYHQLTFNDIYPEVMNNVL